MTLAVNEVFLYARLYAHLATDKFYNGIDGCFRR